MQMSDPHPDEVEHRADDDGGASRGSPGEGCSIRGVETDRSRARQLRRRPCRDNHVLAAGAERGRDRRPDRAGAQDEKSHVDPFPEGSRFSKDAASASNVTVRSFFAILRRTGVASRYNP